MIGIEKPRTYCFPDKDSAKGFIAGLGRRGDARISGRARLRKTLTTRLCGRSMYRAKGYDDSYTVTLTPWSFADIGQINALSREHGAVPEPFADWN